VYGRRRTAKPERPYQTADAVKIVEETGTGTGQWRRAVDSTILADALARTGLAEVEQACRRCTRPIGSDSAC
jgi:hypothetical protein